MNQMFEEIQLQDKKTSTIKEDKQKEFMEK
jgi:hypothetical protein